MVRKAALTCAALAGVLLLSDSAWSAIPRRIPSRTPAATTQPARGVLVTNANADDWKHTGPKAKGAA